MYSGHGDLKGARGGGRGGGNAVIVASISFNRHRSGHGFLSFGYNGHRNYVGNIDRDHGGNRKCDEECNDFADAGGVDGTSTCVARVEVLFVTVVAMTTVSMRVGL